MQSFPDVERMTEAHLNEFLDSSSLADWQKAELREATDKNGYFQRAEKFRRADIARSKYVEFHSYLCRKGVFVKPEIKRKFERYSDLLNAALIEHEHRIRHDDLKLRENSDRLSKEGGILLKEIERDVQDRLWSSPEKQNLG